MIIILLKHWIISLLSSGQSDSTGFELFELVLNQECQEIMGSNKKSWPSGFDNLVQNFPAGEFILDVFNELIFNPLKLKGTIISNFLTLQSKVINKGTSVSISQLIRNLYFLDRCSTWKVSRGQIESSDKHILRILCIYCSNTNS